MPTPVSDPLLAAARRARLDGWHEWEVPEVVMAVARNLEIRCPPNIARSVAAEAFAREDEGQDLGTSGQ
jgi:hypothetical protein